MNEKMKHTPDEKPKNDAAEKNLAIGISLGVALGAAFGVALGNLGVGMGIGIALGAAFGASGFEKSEKKKNGE